MQRVAGSLATAAGLAMAIATAPCPGIAAGPSTLAPATPGTGAPLRLLLLDLGADAREGRHRLSSTQAPGSRVIAEVLPPGSERRGSVALFDVFARGRAELRRLPAQGREDDATPLCRILERGNHDPATPEVDGRWRVVSRGSDGAVNRLTWEWWGDGRELAGRFDPDTDYRFAQLARGIHDGRRVAFLVHYIQDRYEVTGVATAGGWAGSWRKVGEDGHGTWNAERASPEEANAHAPSRQREPAVALRRWIKKSDGSAWHGLEGEVPPGDGWELDAELGRAWKWRTGAR